MILSLPSVMVDDMDEHPWTGLSREDLAWAYPAMSECAGLGHPMVKLPDGERFADYHQCICGAEYLNRYGERRLTPDPSDYRDPIDPRDWTDMAFLDDYEPVADRITAFWKDHPEGRIVTDLVFHDGERFIVKALIWRKPTGENLISPDGTGYAEEVIGSTNVNRTSALENCETSAIGRALANLGYAVKNRASREEMAKAQPAPRQRSGGRRSPTPVPPAIQSPTEAAESHKKAPQADLEPDIAAEVKRLKNWAFKQLGGDVDRTKQIWAEVLATYDLKPDDLPLKESIQFIEADLSLEIGKALVGELVQPELVAEDERPFENAV